MTPPELATGDGEIEGASYEHGTLATLFAQKPKSDLGPWIDTLGPWSYV